VSLASVHRGKSLLCAWVATPSPQTQHPALELIQELPPKRACLVVS
jgi:hypothetical protein